MKITLKAAIIVPIAIYLCYGIYLYVNQKSMIYFPNHQDFYRCSGFSGYEKINFNGTKFYIRNKGGNKIIVYYHGNAGSACDRSYLKDFFDKTDYSVMFVEYAGYSNDSYKPSLSLLLNDVVNVSYYLKIKKFNDVVLFGRSLGTGLASYHSYISQVNKMILVTPFTTFVDLVKYKYSIFPINYILTEKYNNLERLKNYKKDILIIHGNLDEIIPIKFGKKLFDDLNTTKKEFEIIEGKGHNNLEDSEIYFDKIYEFIMK